jgi:hypothetical protein
LESVVELDDDNKVRHPTGQNSLTY